VLKVLCFHSGVVLVLMKTASPLRNARQDFTEAFWQAQIENSTSYHTNALVMYHRRGRLTITSVLLTMSICLWEEETFPNKSCPCFAHRATSTTIRPDLPHSSRVKHKDRHMLLSRTDPRAEFCAPGCMWKLLLTVDSLENCRLIHQWRHRFTRRERELAYAYSTSLQRKSK